MQNYIPTRKIIKNMMMSVLAQIVSLATSFALGFIVPKFISEQDYSYWQIYILYVSYVGILHFGLLDGLVLRYSQYDYEDLDKARLRSQFQFMVSFISAIAFLCCIYAYIFLRAISAHILVLIALGMVSKNVFTYTSYTFQITNRISKYAILVIAQRTVYAITVILMIITGATEYYWYCIADLLGDVSGFIIGLSYNREMYLGKKLALIETLKEAKTNILAGINLMIANFASSFIMGGAKMIIQWKWDSLVFGKIAFSFSVTNLFLTFVTALSVVLFPSLKRTEKDKLPNLYLDIRNVISPLLFIVLLAYFPMCAILEIWLPKYTPSLKYIGVLMPSLIFSSKVSLLTNNYLKAYRKEKVMLNINIVTVIFSFISFIISAYLLDNLNLLLYFVVAAIMLRSVVSEIVVSDLIHVVIKKDYLIEFIITVWFIIVINKFNLLIGMLLYFFAVVVYLIIYRSNIKKIAKFVLNL